MRSRSTTKRLHELPKSKKKDLDSAEFKKQLPPVPLWSEANKVQEPTYINITPVYSRSQSPENKVATDENYTQDFHDLIMLLRRKFNINSVYSRYFPATPDKMGIYFSSSSTPYLSGTANHADAIGYLIDTFKGIKTIETAAEGLITNTVITFNRNIANNIYLALQKMSDTKAPPIYDYTLSMLER